MRGDDPHEVPQILPGVHVARALHLVVVAVAAPVREEMDNQQLVPAAAYLPFVVLAAQVREDGDVLGDRVVDLVEPPLVQDHHGRDGDRFGHRPDREDGVRRDRCVAGAARVHDGVGQRLLAPEDPRHAPARDAPGDQGALVGLDVLLHGASAAQLDAMAPAGEDGERQDGCGDRADSARSGVHDRSSRERPASWAGRARSQSYRGAELPTPVARVQSRNGDERPLLIQGARPGGLASASLLAPSQRPQHHRRHVVPRRPQFQQSCKSAQSAKRDRLGTPKKRGTCLEYSSYSGPNRSRSHGSSAKGDRPSSTAKSTAATSARSELHRSPKPR